MCCVVWRGGGGWGGVVEEGVSVCIGLYYVQEREREREREGGKKWISKG